MKKFVGVALALLMALVVVLPTYASSNEEELFNRLYDPIILADGKPFVIGDALYGDQNIASAKQALEMVDLSASQIAQVDALIDKAQAEVAKHTHKELAYDHHDLVNGICADLAVQAASLAGLKTEVVKNQWGEWVVKIVTANASNGGFVIKNTGAQE